MAATLRAGCIPVICVWPGFETELGTIRAEPVLGTKHTAVSTKVVLKKCNSVRDNADRYYG